MKLWFHKLTHWEYWPFGAVYFPVFFLWAFYAIRARTLFFFNAANPSIQNGGFMMESKKAIYDLISAEFYPNTILIPASTTVEEMGEIVNTAGINFPLIAKPDIGLRGIAVQKIISAAELRVYHQKATFDYIVQDLIALPNEVGIFYVRLPNEAAGTITGIVSKEFLTVTGDGVQTVAQLILRNPRAAMQFKALQAELGEEMQEVLPSGKTVKLVPYGNHARGAKFIDVSHWATPALEQQIDAICRKIDGFYFGRLDIMYQTIEDLERGENFAIVELNGAGSEPTHIYDPRHSIFFAWKELFRHISLMYKISVLNHQNGAPYLPHKKGMHEYRRHLRHQKTIAKF